MAPEPGVAKLNRRRWRYGALAVLLAAAAATGGYLVGRPTKAGSATAPATKTVAAVRTDLVETASYDGTLSFANSRSLLSSANGVVTTLPAAGTTIVQGKALYLVNEVPTFLMYGTVPMYRPLRAGVTAGSDVRQLETDLKVLGYDPDGMVVDATFDSATTAALNAWKTAVGLTADGAVMASQIQFSSGPIHVESVSAAVGQRANDGAPLYTATDTSRVVTVSLSTADAGLAHVHDAVSVTLPSGSSVPAHISSVATAAASNSNTSTGSGGGSTNQGGGSVATNSATVAVTITVDKPASVASLDSAPVTVVLTQQRAKNVIAVPVTALLALAGTGYAVQVLDASGATRLVAVTPGLYSANGLVEIKGASIVVGTRVIVPASS